MPKQGLLPIVCSVAVTVLCMAFAVTFRVMRSSPYSLRVVPADPVSKDTLQRWDDLEASFAQRGQPGDDVHPNHDPLWPAFVARAASAPADPEPTVVAKASSGEHAALRPLKIEAPAFVAPRLLGLMLDRHARAVLQQDGKSHVVQSGDRLGAVQVVDVSTAGVLIEWKGGRRLLQMTR
jgi:hypothetical protein